MKHGALPVTRVFSESSLLDHDRLVSLVVPGELSEERAKRVFVVCSISLLWVLGLLQSATSQTIEIFGIKISGSPTTICILALVLVGYTVLSWGVSIYRDGALARNAVSKATAVLAAEARAVLEPGMEALNEHAARDADLGPKLKAIEAQIAAARAKHAESIARAREALNIRAAQTLASDSREAADALADALSDLDDAQAALRADVEPLEHKRDELRSQLSLKPEVVRLAVALMADRSPDQAKQVLERARWRKATYAAIETWPVAFLAAVTTLSLVGRLWSQLT